MEEKLDQLSPHTNVDEFMRNLEKFIDSDVTYEKLQRIYLDRLDNYRVSCRIPYLAMLLYEQKKIRPAGIQFLQEHLLPPLIEIVANYVCDKSSIPLKFPELPVNYYRKHTSDFTDDELRKVLEELRQFSPQIYSDPAPFGMYKMYDIRNFYKMMKIRRDALVPESFSKEEYTDKYPIEMMGLIFSNYDGCYSRKTYDLVSGEDFVLEQKNSDAFFDIVITGGTYAYLSTSGLEIKMLSENMSHTFPENTIDFPLPVRFYGNYTIQTDGNKISYSTMMYQTKVRNIIARFLECGILSILNGVKLPIFP